MYKHTIAYVLAFLANHFLVNKFFFRVEYLNKFLEGFREPLRLITFLLAKCDQEIQTQSSQYDKVIEKLTTSK